MLDQKATNYGTKRMARDFGRWALWQPTKVLLFAAGLLVETIETYR